MSNSIEHTSKKHPSVQDYAKLKELVIVYLLAHDAEENFHNHEPDDSEEHGRFHDPEHVEMSSRLRYACRQAREALRAALMLTGPLQRGDRVRPTATARQFLAEGVIKDPSTIVGFLPGDESVRLEPPTKDFMPGGGVPVAWLERIFP